MNNIIPVSRLGELLAAKTGADIQSCTKFVKEYFALIEATLASGEDVTIKGIGTFRLTGNDENPVVYEVDETLANTVNAPFEAFEAFELTDGELTDDAQPAPTPKPIVVPEPVIEPEEEPAAEEPAVEEPVPAEEPAPAEEPVPAEEPAPTEEPVAETINLEDPADTELNSDEDTDSDEDTESESTSIFPRGLTLLWMMIVFVLGLLLGIAGGYFGHSHINQFMAGTPAVEAVSDTTAVDTTKTAMLADEPADTIKAEQPTEPEPQQEAKPKQQEPRYDTITTKVYLTTLARKYYGNMDYWVYIYDANDLKHPDRIKPGTQVRVPYLEELNLTGDETTDIKAAKQRAVEIYKKFK